MHLGRAGGKAVIVLCGLLAATRSEAQGTMDSVTVARVAAVGRLWGVVKYFHPAFLNRAIPWDSVTVEAIERIQQAKSTAEYGAAVSTMLAVLGDPSTRVTPKEAPTSASTPRWSWGRRWEVTGIDSTLVVSVPNLEDFNVAIKTLTDATADVQRASRIVFDLRGYEPSDMGAAQFIFHDISEYLPIASVAAPSQRRRMYSGFVPQEGTSSGGYWSGTYQQAGDVFAVAKPSGSKRVVFLVSPHSDIPPIAFALRGNGQGAIVVDGPTTDLAAGAVTYPVDLGEGLQAIVRVSEMEGNGAADTAVVHGNDDAALRLALVVAHQPGVVRRVPVTHSAYVPVPDLPFASPTYPRTGARILAAYRWWNAIHYFYPYKHLIGEDWGRVLPQSIPLLAAARDSVEYAKTVAEMVTHIHDSHGWVGGSAGFRDFLIGKLPTAVQVQYVEGESVVISVANDSATRASGIAVGDVVLEVDGETVAAIRARRGPYTAHSTPQALDDAVEARLLRGENAVARVKIRDGRDRVRDIVVPRSAEYANLIRYPRSGPVMKMLPGNIGYADLSLLSVTMVDSMFEMFRNTRGIIFDDRGYPQGTAWAIAPRLTDKAKVADALFQRPVVMSPDSAEGTTYKFVDYTPTTSKWRYHGKTVLLVDERTISQAEHTGLLLEAANRTTIIGSPTMGANGDVTSVVLPGGLTAWFSGHDVRHADGRQLQRVGLQPDIVVRPTLAGVRAGRDEVLERALKFLRK
jgi:C-terminal processing protease CtpA/Prc